MISAILLAAGESKRMKGENKLTKKINNIPLIKHAIKNILESPIEEIIVVVGYQNDVIEKIIDKNSKIKLVLNNNYKNGMSSSIKIGLNYLSKNTEHFFICLGDMPLVNKNIYKKLIESKNKNEIIIPTNKGQQGNPVLFSKSLIQKILTIRGDVGAKEILSSNKDKIFNLEINDQCIIKDFNTADNFVIL